MHRVDARLSFHYADKIGRLDTAMNKYSKKIQAVSKNLDALATSISVGKITRREIAKQMAAAEQTLHLLGNTMRLDLWNNREDHSMVLAWENEDVLDQLTPLREVVDDGDITETNLVASLRDLVKHLNENAKDNGKPQPNKATKTSKSKK